MSDSGLWSWFPLGFAGIRTLLLFVAALIVFVLRVGQLHLGARTTASSFQTFRQKLYSYNTIRTFGWYTLSAWFFSEVYMWSASEDANLGWISVGKYGCTFRKGRHMADDCLDHGSARGSTKGRYI